MSIDHVVVAIVLGWFALMIALVPRGAARARREENRRRLEVLGGDEPQRATVRAPRRPHDAARTTGERVR